MAGFKQKPDAPPALERPGPPRGRWALESRVERVRGAAPGLEAKEVDRALVHARLADHCRDAGLAPPDCDVFERQASGLDIEGWRRLALAAAALDDAALWA